jgi:hypothetical protein
MIPWAHVLTMKIAEHDESRYKHRRMDIVFDTSAEYDGGGDRQRVADAVMEEVRNNGAVRTPRTRRKKTH